MNKLKIWNYRWEKAADRRDKDAAEKFDQNRGPKLGSAAARPGPFAAWEASRAAETLETLRGHDPQTPDAWILEI